MGEPADEQTCLPLSRVAVPLPVARLPISAEVFARGYGQLHVAMAFQTARPDPLVIRSRISPGHFAWNSTFGVYNDETARIFLPDSGRNHVGIWPEREEGQYGRRVRRLDPRSLLPALVYSY